MNIGNRVENHMSELAKKQILGGNLFGYRLKEPVEAYVVKTIFELYTSDDPEVVKTSSSICKYLIDNNMRTFKGDLNWTPSKVIRVLANTKYMGYQLPEVPHL